MGNRTLTERECEGESSPGHSSTLRIERSAKGAPGAFFVIENRFNGMLMSESCVIVNDAREFLAPVIAWLEENE